MIIRRTHAARRHAVAAMEFALLAPFLGFLIVAGVDFARVYYFSLILTNCASTGAIYGSQDPEHAVDEAGIIAAALADASNLSPAPEVSSENLTDSEGHPAVRVTVRWNFGTFTNAPWTASKYELVRTMQMRIPPVYPDNS